MNPPHPVRIGRRVPVRSIVLFIAVTAANMLVFMLAAIGSGIPELLPHTLWFLIFPAVLIPVVITFNTYAEFDPATGFISVNGRPATPVAELRHASCSLTRGVATLTLGYSAARRDCFSLNNTGFITPRIERDWVRYLLPHTGLPRDPASAGYESFSLFTQHPVTLEQAQRFVAERFE